MSKKPHSQRLSDNKQQQVIQSASLTNGQSGGRSQAVEATLQKGIRLAESGQLAKAAELFRHAGPDPALRNALGVVLLRMKAYGPAVDVLRDMALQPNCTFVRRDLPKSYKINFATALLLAGYINGCKDVLGEIHDESNPRVLQLRAALKTWENSLSFWQRLNWRFGQIEPRQRVVTLDFTPGEMFIGEFDSASAM